MTQRESELRAMFALAAPLVLTELGWMAMGIVDTMFVGRVSAEAIGAVSLGTSVFYAIAIFASGLLLGLDTLVSQSFGAGRSGRLSSFAGQRHLAGAVSDSRRDGRRLAVRSGDGQVWHQRQRAARYHSLHSRAELERAAAAVVLLLAALSAVDRRGASDSGHLDYGEPGQRRRQLDLRVRQSRRAAAGRGRIRAGRRAFRACTCWPRWSSSSGGATRRPSP